MINSKQILLVFVLLSGCKVYGLSEDNEILRTRELDTLKFQEQIKIFKKLGYEFRRGVSKDLILRDVYEMTWEEETEKYLEDNPFSALYYFYGWRNSSIEGYNYSDDCIWFDLEFFDSSSQYKWFMERMGVITHGDISFSDIKIETDTEGWEWIYFKVNNISKKWKLEKTEHIADHFVQRFSYLPDELGVASKYTYYDNGGQQWVIDYASDSEQKKFIELTGLKREWLGQGNHFSEPKQ